MHRPIKISDKIEKKIVEIAVKNPRDCYHSSFSTWPLRVIAGFLMDDLKRVDKISHSEIRNILLKHNIKWRKSKTVLSENNDSEYALKKSTLNS